MHIIDTWLEKRHNRATYRQLSNLDDHILSDIGFTRTELEQLRRGRRAASAR